MVKESNNQKKEVKKVPKRAKKEVKRRNLKMEVKIMRVVKNQQEKKVKMEKISQLKVEKIIKNLLSLNGFLLKLLNSTINL